MVLTSRAALATLAGVLLVLPFARAGLLLWALLLVTAVVSDVVRAGGVRPLVLAREGATAGRQGEQLVVTLLVRNDGGRRVRGLLRDAWPPGAGARGRGVHRLDVPAGETRRLDTVLRPARRGDRRPDVVTVRSLGPLGLAGRQGRHAVPWSVRVLPPFTSRRFLPERLARLRQLDGAAAAVHRGQGTEFDSLREYVVGDDVRSIDWRGTARGGEVVVRTWRPERDRRVVVVLDTGRTSAGRVGDVPRLDSALDAALLLAALAARAGDRVDLVAVDRAVRAGVEAATRADVLPRLVQAMAPLEPSLVETDHALLVAEVLRRVRRRSLVVLFTALDPAPLTAGLLPVLGALTSRHTVLLASVGDPLVAAMAGGRGNAEAVYAAAAAEAARGERRRVTAALRRRGVEVVDEPPEHFAPAVADAYLALKAAGRL